MKKMLAMFAIAAAVACNTTTEEVVTEETVGIVDSTYVDPATVGTTTDLEDVVVEGEEASAE